MKHSIPGIHTPDGRRAWSFLVILGSCFVFTVFAAVGVWLVSSNARYSLILALAAHVQLLIGLGAFSFTLGRRMSVEANRDGIKIKDEGNVEITEQPLGGDGGSRIVASVGGSPSVGDPEQQG